MDIATIVGVVGGIGLIAGSILIGGTLGAFVNAPGLLVVIGGTFASTLIAQRMAAFIGAISVAMNTIFDRSPTVEETFETLNTLAEKARKEDLLALESVELTNKFMAKGVRMAVDGVPIEIIRTTLNSELGSLSRRHQSGQKVFRFMGATAPSMGMIGTLIGLVQMLQNLSDPSSIGPAMAVALLTTFYGAVLAFLFFIPIADKLESRTASEALTMRMVIAGLESIVSGENALVLKEKLHAYMSPKQRPAEDAA